VHVEEEGELISIVNNSAHILDLSRWRLVASGQYFIIPDKTVIASGGEAKFSTQITKLSYVRASKQVTLVYPDGKAAVESTERIQPEVVIAAPVATTSETVIEESIETPVVVFKKEIAVPVVSIKKEVEEKVVQPELEKQNSTQAAAVILGTAKESNKMSNYWYFGLAALLLVAIIGILLARPRKLVVDGFEVIEEKE